jgi:transposase-like protein
VETEATVSYKGFRFPAEVISHAVWLYHRFPLSFREIEELLLARGIIVSHETIRAWCEKFGPRYACGILAVNWRSVTATFAETPLLVRFVSDGGELAAGNLPPSATLCN